MNQRLSIEDYEADDMPDDATLYALEQMSVAEFGDMQADMLFWAKERSAWDEDSATILECLKRWREAADTEAAFTLISLLSENAEVYLNESI